MKFLIASLAAVSLMAADGFAQSLSTGAIGGSSGARTSRPGGMVAPSLVKPSGVALAINGKFYHDLKLVSVTGGVAEFESMEGAVSALWTSLPDSYQKQHATEKAVFEARAREAKVEAETPSIHIEVEKVLPVGVLVDLMSEEVKVHRVTSSLGSVGGGGGSASYSSVTYRRSGKTILVVGLADVIDGDKIVIRAKRDGTFSYDGRTVEKWIFTVKLKD